MPSLSPCTSTGAVRGPPCATTCPPSARQHPPSEHVTTTRPCHQEDRAAFIFSNFEVAAISQHLGDEDRAGKWVLFSKPDTKQHHKSILRSRIPAVRLSRPSPTCPQPLPGSLHRAPDHPQPQAAETQERKPTTHHNPQGPALPSESAVGQRAVGRGLAQHPELALRRPLPYYPGRPHLCPLAVPHSLPRSAQPAGPLELVTCVTSLNPHLSFGRQPRGEAKVCRSLLFFFF